MDKKNSKGDKKTNVTINLNNVKIVEYEPNFKLKYQELNFEWINKYFKIESADKEILSNPEYIINNDGHIFFAIVDDEIVGTCNLVKIDDSNYELSKLCVTENYQGYGIGEMLLDSIIKKAEGLKIKKIYLLTSRILNAALNLYIKNGFYEIDRNHSILSGLHRECELSMVLDLNQSEC